jgi:hypothetical protein
MIKELPEVSYTSDEVLIRISKADLINIIEGRSDGRYKVERPYFVCQAIAEKFVNYQTSNSQELGFTALQELFETIIDKVVEDGDDIITFEDLAPQ